MRIKFVNLEANFLYRTKKYKPSLPLVLKEKKNYLTKYIKRKWGIDKDNIKK